MKVPQSKICLVCGKEFAKPKNVNGKAWANRKVCGKICRGQYMSDLLLTDTGTKSCEVCGKTFTRRKTEGFVRWNARRSCSLECGNKIAIISRTGRKYPPGKWPKRRKVIPTNECLVCGKIYQQPEGIYGKIWKNRKTCSMVCRAEWNRRQGYGFKKGHIPISHCPKGLTPWNKGNKGRQPWMNLSGLLKDGSRFKGKKHSDETKAKIRLARAKQVFPTGADHWMWKGGTTPILNKIRRLQDYKKWRKAVFQRDDYTCQDCGIRGSYLNADHIKPFSVIIKEYGITTVEQAKDCQELWDISNGKTLCVDCHRKTETYGVKLSKVTNNPKVRVNPKGNRLVGG